MGRRAAFCVIAVFSLSLTASSDDEVLPHPAGSATVTYAGPEAAVPPAAAEVTFGAPAVEAEFVPPQTSEGPGEPKPGPAAVEGAPRPDARQE